MRIRWPLPLPVRVKRHIRTDHRQQGCQSARCLTYINICDALNTRKKARLNAWHGSRPTLFIPIIILIHVMGDFGFLSPEKARRNQTCCRLSFYFSSVYSPPPPGCLCVHVSIDNLFFSSIIYKSPRSRSEHVLLALLFFL